MAKAIVKCPLCELTFDRNSEEYVQMGRRYAHKRCFEVQEEKTKVERKDLEDLEKYIMKIFNETYVNARVKQQLKRMIEQYNFSYSGILKTLIYFFEVKGNSIDKANGGIGIVPYVYNDARDYYFRLYQAQQKNENKEIKDYVVEGKKIVIPPPIRKQKQIKLFSLGEDE